ncbi:hypothetical protein Lepto7376_2720 [[Leptolyngbya] sp. PCC 7376]|uniref:hypothetical protein n=1 Tax=[Leptolyngbya] sp. PCC 7376 TaxID=111781 RepID=UPI00029F3270|nr:hypothetical protein [[Leptolyngbya] sp. PCC 7376]AFY38984.1 hypothetical protein Lepto7376_2720 [[Leptolyngbya] sp. PCC 7376]
MVTQKILAGAIAEKLVLEKLPLAIYREVAAHLRQVSGVMVELETQRSQEFDYFQSQIGAMIIHYPEDLSDENRKKITAILDFYGDRYGQWQRDALK